MNFPTITHDELIKKLEPPKGKVRMVLDTDTYNEVDDQFALAYALRSSDKLDVEAVYAAPFHNNRSSGPADGMEKSYQEIIKVLDKLGVPSENFAYKGSMDYLKDWNSPEPSEAAEDLVKRAMTCRDDEPLYVVAIGAITNVASAILMQPEIIKKIVVVWLGGNGLHWSHTKEFNLIQDIQSSRLIFDCGVPLVQIPCMGVTTHLMTTIPELEYYMKGKSEISDYLFKIVSGYTQNPFAWSKVIWDIAAVAWLINSKWIPTNIVHSPILTDQVTWSFDNSRHFIRSASYVNRDPIFADVFKKLAR